MICGGLMFLIDVARPSVIFPQLYAFHLVNKVLLHRRAADKWHSVCRAQNNGWSTDNVRPEWRLD